MHRLWKWLREPRLEVSVYRNIHWVPKSTSIIGRRGEFRANGSLLNLPLPKGRRLVVKKLKRVERD